MLCRLWLFGALAASAGAMPDMGMSSMGRRRVQARTGQASDWAGEDAAAARNNMVYKDDAGMVKSCLGGPICGEADMSGDDTTSRAACESALRGDDQQTMCQYRVEKYEACANPVTAIIVTLVLTVGGTLGFTGAVMNWRGSQKEAAMYGESGETVNARVIRAWAEAANAGEKNRDRRTHGLQVEYVVKLPGGDSKQAFAKVNKEFQASYEFQSDAESDTVGEYMSKKVKGDLVQVRTLACLGEDARAAEILGASGEYEGTEGMGGDARTTTYIAGGSFLFMVVPLFFTVYDCGISFLGIFGPCMAVAAAVVLKRVLDGYASKLSDPDGDIEYLADQDGSQQLVTPPRERAANPPARAQRSEAVRPASQNSSPPTPAPQLRENLIDQKQNPTSNRYDSDEELSDDEDAV